MVPFKPFRVLGSKSQLGSGCPMFQIAGIDVTQVVTVLIVLTATYLAAKIVYKVLSKTFEKAPLPEIVENWIVKISKYVIYVLGFFVAISVLGVDLTSLVVGLGVFSIAISFAMSNIIQNFVSGVLVQADHVFKCGDCIAVQGYEGRVVKVSVRTTIIETKEGNLVFIPNSVFATSPVLKHRQELNNS